jgi:mono/diheme cytochrome c family protein
MEWIASLDSGDPNYSLHQLEALWVMWGINEIDSAYLSQVLESQDPRVRAGAVRVVRYASLENQTELLQKAAGDPNSRVRLEAIVAASWLAPDEGLQVLEVAAQQPLDDWMRPSYESALAVLGTDLRVESDDTPEKELPAISLGQEIYERDGYCGTCHQPDGKGLPGSGFPPLAGTSWVLGDEELIIKIVLKGLMGPIEVLGTSYPGQVPMTPYENMLSDEEIAAVVTYVRSSFGNNASAVDAETVARVRKEIEGKSGFYSPEELRAAHPK